VVGFVLFFVLSLLQPTFYRSSAKLAYVGALLVMSLVLVFGRDIRGTKGWL
jgi:cell division protein FtsW (lipid II flippase)